MNQMQNFNNQMPSANDRMITPFADEYIKFADMSVQGNSLNSFLWANENAKNYIFNYFHPTTENMNMFTLENNYWVHTEIIN